MAPREFEQTEPHRGMTGGPSRLGVGRPRPIASVGPAVAYGALKQRPLSVDGQAVDATPRIQLGHGLIMLGLAVRRVTQPLALALLAAIAVASAVSLATKGALVEPFALARLALSTSGPLTWLWQTLVVGVGMLAAGRAVAFTIAGIGWSLFPASHRDLLTRAVLPGPPAQVD